jgi:hypothetical protein
MEPNFLLRLGHEKFGGPHIVQYRLLPHNTQNVRSTGVVLSDIAAPAPGLGPGAVHTVFDMIDTGSLHSHLEDELEQLRASAHRQAMDR